MPSRPSGRYGPALSTKASAGRETCLARGEPSTARDVIDDEHVLDHAERAQEIAKLLVFRVRQVGVAGRQALERQLIDVREPEILPFRAVVDAILERDDARNLSL